MIMERRVSDEAHLRYLVGATEKRVAQTHSCRLLE